MLKRQTSKLLLAIPVMTIFAMITSIASAAQTGAVYYSAAGVLTVNGIALTVSAESNATSVIVTDTSLAVTTGASDTFTVTSLGNFDLGTNSSAVKQTCGASSTQIVIPASTVISITPLPIAPSCPSAGGGSSGSPAPAATPASPATPATPAVPGVTPAIPATPATPAIPANSKVVIELPAIKGAAQESDVGVDKNGKVAVRTALTSDDGAITMDIGKGVKLTGFAAKGDKILSAPAETDSATVVVDIKKTPSLKSKTIKAAYDLDADAIKASKPVAIKIALGADVDTKGLKAVLLNEKTGKTQSITGTFNKSTHVFSGKTQYLGGFTLIFVAPTPVVKKK